MREYLIGVADGAAMSARPLLWGLQGDGQIPDHLGSDTTAALAVIAMAKLPVPVLAAVRTLIANCAFHAGKAGIKPVEGQDTVIRLVDGDGKTLSIREGVITAWHRIWEERYGGIEGLAQHPERPPREDD